jgi:DNA-binding response OmpR family regulator
VGSAALAETSSTGARFSVAVLQPGVDEQRLILVVEDDDLTRAFLLDNLVADGFRAVGASGVGEGLRAIEVRQPSLVVLDLVLDDGSGLNLLDRIRTADGLASRLDPDLPVLVLTGRAGEADRVRSFDRGADDHLCKPFLYAELLARVRAVLRRAEGRRAKGVLRVRDLTIDPTTRIVRLAGSRIELSAKEFALLHALAAEPTRVYRKQELLRDVWGYLAVGNTRTLDAHASRLRKKLGRSRRPWVLNVRGVGYKLTEAP